MDITKKLEELNITLPEPPKKGGMYSSVKIYGGCYAYVSGCGPVIGTPVQGRLGAEFSIPEGQIYARNCMLNILAVLKRELGDLNRLKGAIKILTFVSSAEDFFDQPEVANGGSQLLKDLFGEEGLPARSAVGVSALPGNIPVETEALFEIE
ncbi:MAG: RidA family protein [Clostridiales bacterium]|jgi:enamine deaminase RidA (YjgF/YER057c/UK114 family)|nr:RidA family protein [Clostridiales bacterium]